MGCRMDMEVEMSSNFNLVTLLFVYFWYSQNDEHQINRWECNIPVDSQLIPECMQKCEGMTTKQSS